MSDSEKTYKQLQENGRTGYVLRSISYLLEFDQETVMPEGGLEIRAEQNQLLSTLRHKQMTSKKVKRRLEALCNLETGAITAHDLNEEQKASVKEMRRDYVNDAKLSASFIQKFSDATTLSLQAWKSAKRDNSFKDFAPHLKKNVTLSKKRAELLGYTEHPYDALLDQFEPGMKVSILDSLFKDLKERLIYILQKRQEMKLNVDNTFLTSQFFSIPQQRQLAVEIIEQMGLPKQNYCLGEAAHPFCLPAHPNDQRQTTHYHADDFRKGFFAVMHECGHALYEFGLDPKHIGTPLAEAASFGIHESQSRFWECYIGHSHPFWRNMYPKIKDAFPDAFSDIPLDHFVKAINTATPSLIRIFADEVTYNLHIILRYEIEKGLIEGSINVKDIPKIWKQKMHESLGITPKTDAEGCLQDIHWSLGAFGYFPSYALGNIYAGALFVHMMKTHTSWEQKIASGDMSFINKFLKEKIHRFGRQYPPKELIEKATGEPFTVNPYISYLEGKFL